MKKKSFSPHKLAKALGFRVLTQDQSDEAMKVPLTEIGFVYKSRLGNWGYTSKNHGFVNFDPSRDNGQLLLIILGSERAKEIGLRVDRNRGEDTYCGGWWKSMKSGYAYTEDCPTATQAAASAITKELPK